MAKLIALTSTGPLSGKSTLAKYLEREYGFIRADHSLTLVSSFVLQANNLPHPERSGLVLPLTVETVYDNKEFYRTRLQEHGNRIGFNDPGQARSWLVTTIIRSGAHVVQARCPGAKPQITSPNGVVFDSFRGEAQAQALRELGFTLVQLHIGEDERMYRAMKSGASYHKILKSMVEHPELELGIHNPDITLNGELPVEVLARSLMDQPTHLREELDARG